MPKCPIEPGRRYREIRRAGSASGDEWIVEGITDRLGLKHARLIITTDLTKRKTLSVRALADPTRFEEM